MRIRQWGFHSYNQNREIVYCTNAWSETEGNCFVSVFVIKSYSGQQITAPAGRLDILSILLDIEPQPLLDGYPLATVAGLLRYVTREQIVNSPDELVYVRLWVGMWGAW